VYIDICQEGAFRCAEGKCIRGTGNNWLDGNRVCNGIADCQGGEDEVTCGKWC
jgi:hypothetical protein